MYYVIQENLFREFHFNTLIEYLKRYNLEYETVPFKPFTGVIEHVTDRKDVWFFGSVNGANVAKQYGWNPGSLANENHDHEVYGPKYGKEMLNSDGFVIKIGDPLPESLPYTFFARPTGDTKTFSGGLFTKDSWKEWIEDLTSSNMMQSVTEETKVLFAPLKSHIQQEIRCWIVNGEPVTISQYKIGDRVVYQNMDNNPEAIIYARNIAKLYSPAKAYVLDICLWENEYKVVEINCINCSGFYDGDMSKLIQALENTFNK